MHMFNLYRHCTQCLVLPGGIQRLVSLDEETSWVHRAWTLQEAMVPRASFVLFAWTWKSGELSNSGGDLGVKLRVVVPGHCGLTGLSFLVSSCISGELNFNGEIMGQKQPPMQKGKNGWRVLVRVIGAAKSPNLVSLQSSLNTTKSNELRDRGIWQSVFGRTSSRPVDMVFSVMGLFGVTLNPAAFD